MEPDWKAAFYSLMDYIIHYEPTTADEYNLEWLKEYSMGVQEGCNSPSKPLSQEIHIPPKDCIKKALKRLRDEFGFGVPDKSEAWKDDPVVLKALKEELDN